MARKSWDELNLMDNELMNIVASDPNVDAPFCKRVLSVLLEKEIRNIRVNVQRFIPGINSEKRGVCLDVEVDEEEVQGETTKVTEVYDLEPHHADKTDDYPRMMRFRHAKIDSRGMKKGNKKFKDLPDLYMILMILHPFRYYCLARNSAGVNAMTLLFLKSFTFLVMI